MPVVQIQNVSPYEIPDEMTGSSRFAPIQQNYNPPVADPAAQAATLALGYHRWHEAGGAP